MRQNRLLDRVTRFIGYGDISQAKLFFMGIEEHDVLKEEQITSFIDKEYLYLPNPYNAYAKGTTERMQCLIYRKMFSNLSDNQIFESEIHCFNYYPIGAPSVGRIGANVSELLGFEPKTKQDIYNYFDNETDRIGILKRFIEEKIISQNKLLIIFGKWIRHKVIDLLPNADFNDEFTDWSLRRGRPSPIQWSRDKRIWLMGHPSYRWITEEVVDSMVKIRAAKD